MALEQIRPPLGVQIELRKNVPSQSGQMHIDPIIRPIDLLRPERMARGIGGLQRGVKLANVDAVEGINQLLNVGPIDLDHVAREVHVFRDPVDRALEFARMLRFFAQTTLRANEAAYFMMRGIVSLARS